MVYHIVLPVIPNLKSLSIQLVSEFTTRNDLINALAQSCFIPLYSGFEFPKQEDGNFAIDGAYTDNLPVFEVCFTFMPF